MSWVNGANFNSLVHIESIYEIRNRLKLLGKTEVVYNSRALNFFADSLAKQGSSNCGDFVHIMNI